MEAQVVQRAQVKTVLGQLDESFLQALTEELYEQRREELHERALAEVSEAQQERLERELERTRDELAKHKAILDDEVEGELDRRFEQGRRELEDELSEKLDTLKGQRDEARQARDRAEALLLSLVRQLLGTHKPVYLRSAGIEELDLESLNAVLAKHQLHVQAEMTYSERVVQCKLKGDQWRGRTRFQLESSASEPDEHAGALALPEASADV